MRNKLILSSVLILLLAIFFIGFSSALSCNFPNTQINVNTGETPSPISIACSNTGTSSVQLWSQGNFFTNSPSLPLTINSNSSQSFTIIFNQISQAGLSTGYFWSSDGLMQNIIVNATQSNPTGCQLNPSMASYTQTAQTSTVTPLPKIMFSPTNCQGNIVYDSSHIYMEGGIISSGIRKPVSITSIVSDGVNLEINTNGLNSQTYSSTLKVNAFSKTFEIPFVIIVTSGNSQQGNVSVNNLPTCSLNSITLNLNQTYSLTCSNLQTDISIVPSVDNNYIKGVGLSPSTSQYVWNFVGKKVGITNVSACFNYLGASMGDCFTQAVQITNSGTALLGSTSLDFVFYQNGNSVNLENLKSVETVINVVDNSTRNLISSYELLLNGVLVNNTLTLETSKNYELRAKSFGYSDKLVSFNVSSAQLTLSIFPNKDIYLVGDLVNLSSNIENVTFLVDNEIVSSPYTFVSQGTAVLRAEKEGYIYSERNITVNPVVTYSSLFSNGKAVNSADLKRNSKVIMKLTEDSIWNVYFSEEYKEENTKKYKSPVILESGVGSEVSFDTKGYGVYEIKAKKDISANEYLVLNSLITSKQLDLKEIWANYWGWILSVGALLIAVIIILFVVKSKSPIPSTRTPISFGGSQKTSEFETQPGYD